MKEQSNVFDYSEQIMKALRRGILLNTNGDKFNSMVISWGHFGIIWGQPVIHYYDLGFHILQNEWEIVLSEAQIYENQPGDQRQKRRYDKSRPHTVNTEDHASEDR